MLKIRLMGVLGLIVLLIGSGLAAFSLGLLSFTSSPFQVSLDIRGCPERKWTDSNPSFHVLTNLQSQPSPLGNFSLTITSDSSEDFRALISYLSKCESFVASVSSGFLDDEYIATVVNIRSNVPLLKSAKRVETIAEAGKGVISVDLKSLNMAFSLLNAERQSMPGIRFVGVVPDAISQKTFATWELDWEFSLRINGKELISPRQPFGDDEAVFHADHRLVFLPPPTPPMRLAAGKTNQLLDVMNLSSGSSGTQVFTVPFNEHYDQAALFVGGGLFGAGISIILEVFLSSIILAFVSKGSDRR